MTISIHQVVQVMPSPGNSALRSGVAAFMMRRSPPFMFRAEVKTVKSGGRSGPKFSSLAGVTPALSGQSGGFGLPVVAAFLTARRIGASVATLDRIQV